MAGVRNEPLKSGKYRGWYMNWKGKAENFTGTTSKKQTLVMARKFEDDGRQIRLGYRQPPTSSEVDRPFNDSVLTYLEAGKANGGRNGFGWSAEHASKQEARLEYWRKELNLKSLHDLRDVFPKVQQHLIVMQARELSGKTLNDYADTLRTFCSWCKKCGFLDRNPLDGVASFREDPTRIARALSIVEIGRLLPISGKQRLLYETALGSGLRRGELGALRVKHLTTSGLILEAAWTKSRRAGFQPLPPWLSKKLIESVAGKESEDHVFWIPKHLERYFKKHLVAAKIIQATEGELTPHSLRHTYSTLIERAGAREVQRKQLSRHSQEGITDSRYTHLEKAELQVIVDKVGEWIATSPAVAEAENLPQSRHGVVGGEAIDSVNTSPDNVLQLHEVAEGEGFEPPRPVKA